MVINWNRYRGMVGHRSARALYFSGSVKRFGRSVRLGGRDEVSINLMPQHPDAFNALKMPINQPSAWRAREKRAVNAICYALGYHIKHVLTDVLHNSRNASKYDFSVPGLKSSTLAIRLARGSSRSTALNDTGALARSVKVEVPREGRRMVKVSFEGSIPGGSGRKRLAADNVAALVEFGHSIVVTKKMQAFFAVLAKKEGDPTFVPKVGKRLVVRPRPFLRPSVDAGTRIFKEDYLSKNGPASTLYEMYFGSGGRVGSTAQVPAGYRPFIGPMRAPSE